jgi:hypothetical protein
MVCTRSALINKYGFVRKANLQLVPSEKFRRLGDDSIDDKVNIVSDPVFSIAQFRGEAVYHVIVEGLSRLTLYYEHLMANTEIKIHMTVNKFIPFMEFLGFSQDRIVSRHILAKSAVMFPEPYQSGSKRPYTMKKLRSLLISRLFHYYQDLERDKHILIIRRSKTRSVSNFEVMVSALKDRFPEEKFVIFRDDPAPPVNESFRMFYEAKMVIGPHGAGLSNTLVCKPGTPIIEFLTDEKTLNTCFVFMSSYLRLQHEAFAPAGSSLKGSFNVSTDTLLQIVSKYI